jgi:CheY-like chemotaxis protein
MSATTDRKPRALLLDDDPTVLRLLGTALEARGFEVLAAMDGESGVTLLIDELLAGIDVVVTDLELPGRDAWSLLHLLRGPGGERDLGIVVLADEAGAPLRSGLLALGADRVVDFGAGHAAAVDAIAAVADRTAAGAPVQAPPRAPLRGVLLVARDALACRALAAAAG